MSINNRPKYKAKYILINPIFPVTNVTTTFICYFQNYYLLFTQKILEKNKKIKLVKLIEICENNSVFLP